MLRAHVALTVSLSLKRAFALTMVTRFHASTTTESHEEHTPQEQRKHTSGIAAFDLEPTASIAMAAAPPKRGRYQPRRISGAQREVLDLYRKMHKEVRRFESAATQDSLKRFIRREFAKHRDIPRKMVSKIEWQLHYGNNKLEELRSWKSSTKFSLRE